MPSLRSLAAMTLLIATLSTAQAGAAALKGKVVSSTENHKPYVLVEIAGKDRIYTKSDGSFVVDLAPGTYNIRITEKNNYMDFKIAMGSSETNKTFKLKW